MPISDTVNLLNNQTSTAAKEKLLELSKSRSAEGDEKVDAPETSASATPITDASNAVNDDVTEQFDTFLKLLTAQIENQDPLAPLDSTQFVEQLATFSGLELQATANNSLTQIAELLTQQIALDEAHDQHNANTQSL